MTKTRRLLALIAFGALLGAGVVEAAPARACLPYDGSCGWVNPDPHTDWGWCYGCYYGPGWYYGHYWRGGPWNGYW